jgi:transcriptional regulator with XRE-family HTH domain
MSQTGKNVRMYRERLKWTQEQLAERVGYSNAGMISQIEDGIKSPSLEKAQDLAVQLGVSLSQLVGDAGAWHTVTNNATGDHTVIQNIEGHYCVLKLDDLHALVQTEVARGLTEMQALLTAGLADLKASLRPQMDGEH